MVGVPAGDKQSAILGLVGAAIGVALAYFCGQLISSRVYAIRASDPLILGVATLLITAITVLTTTIPAAAQLNPATALQSE